MFSEAQDYKDVGAEKRVECCIDKGHPLPSRAHTPSYRLLLPPVFFPLVRRFCWLQLVVRPVPLSALCLPSSSPAWRPSAGLQKGSGEREEKEKKTCQKVQWGFFCCAFFDTSFSRVSLALMTILDSRLHADQLWQVTNSGNRLLRLFLYRLKKSNIQSHFLR